MCLESNLASSYTGVRTVVLGASGFIGRWVARTLCKSGANVFLFVLDRAIAEPVFSEYSIAGQVIEIDLLQSNKVCQALQNIMPSIVFNLAGYGVNPIERNELIAYQVNADLVREICHWIAEFKDKKWSGQHLVHVGSALEYGNIHNNLAEDSEPNPTTLYGNSKLAGTKNVARYCPELGIRGLTARLFSVYGPGELPKRLLPSLLETASTEQPLPLTVGRQKRDFTYVEDIAEGLLRLGLSTALPGEIVNLATGVLTSVRDFIETAAKILHIPQEALLFGAIPTREGEMHHLPVNIQRLKSLLSWNPATNVPDGIRKTQEWMMIQGRGND